MLSIRNLQSSKTSMIHMIYKYALCLLLIVGTTSCATVAPPEEVLEPVQVDDYKLGRGDKISIQVFDEPDLSIGATVGASGVINYSYLGDVVVGGKTADEVEDTISKLLENGFLVNPSVNVTVTEFRAFFINGEVRQPGSYPYQPGLTLDKAIALAGGLTDRASTRKMFVVRGERSNKKSVNVRFSSQIAPGDIISIEEGFF